MKRPYSFNSLFLMIFLFSIVGFYKVGRAQDPVYSWTCEGSFSLFNSETRFGSSPRLPVVTDLRGNSWTHTEDQYLFGAQQTLFCGVIQNTSQDDYFLIKINSPSYPARPTRSTGKLSIIASPVENPSCVLLDYLKEKQLAELLFEVERTCHLSTLL